MENFLLSVNAVAPMFLLMAAGFLSQMFGVLTRDDVPRFNRLAFRVFLPTLLFYNIYTSDLRSVVNTKLLLFAVCGIFIVWLAAAAGVNRWEPHQDRKGPMAQGIFRSNFVIMGIPIAEALVGKDQIASIALLIAVTIPMFNFLAVLILERFRGGRMNVGKVLLEILKNPLIISSMLGILFQLLGIRLPKLADGLVSSLAGIASPLQLFLLGAFFRFDGLKKYFRPLAVVTTVKLIVTPAIVLTIAAAMGFRGTEFVGLLGLFAAPSAVNSFTMVQQMKCGDAELAGDIVVVTSAACILTFFMWILLFKSLGLF